MAKKAPVEVRVVAQNRKARHNYFIVDKIEAGLVLTGTEVKSMRAGGCQLTDAHAAQHQGVGDEEGLGELRLYHLGRAALVRAAGVFGGMVGGVG